MGKTRLEAFSDGVIAIIITIMVLELKAPHGADLQALLPIIPVFLSYLLAHILIRDNGPDCALAKAIGKDRKGIASIAIYLLGVIAAIWSPWISLALYVIVAIMWFVPDRRVENSLRD
jgi:uncharacterized membrane protein